MPSNRSVPICSPGLPGGRFAALLAAASCRVVNDSNGSRRATFVSLPAAPSAAAAAGAWVPAFLVLVLADAFAVPVFAGGGVGVVFVCAYKPLPAAASRLATTSILARRMARSFLLTVFSPPADSHPEPLSLCLRLQEAYPPVS